MAGKIKIEKRIKIKCSIEVISIIIFVILLALKLTNVVDWSWWIIFLPLIITAGLVLVLLLLIFICWLTTK